MIEQISTAWGSKPITTDDGITTMDHFVDGILRQASSCPEGTDIESWITSETFRSMGESQVAEQLIESAMLASTLVEGLALNKALSDIRMALGYLEVKDNPYAGKIQEMGAGDSDEDMSLPFFEMEAHPQDVFDHLRSQIEHEIVLTQPLASITKELCGCPVCQANNLVESSAFDEDMPDTDTWECGYRPQRLKAVIHNRWEIEKAPPELIWKIGLIMMLYDMPFHIEYEKNTTKIFSVMEKGLFESILQEVSKSL